MIALFLFGGDVINTFAFVLMFGIIVGTYSSIYIASPIALGVSNLLGEAQAGPPAAAESGDRTAGRR